ncbi:MAG: hypothetical protein LLG06_12750 [Desulfobacteraceae bacterium]|nr:hypothetical protein [Desulfobacteraceae bacterium]
MHSNLRTHVHLIVFSLAMGAIVLLVIEYLMNREVSFRPDDPCFLLLSGGFFLLFLLCRSLAARAVRCSVCGTVAHDVLILGDGESKRFCREHAIDRFRKEFTAHAGKMVVFHPCLESRRGPYRYEFRSVGDMPGKFFQSEMGRLIKLSLAAIGGKCSRCGKDASVAYFGPGSVPWEPVRADGTGMGELHAEEFARRFLPTCASCIVDEVSLSLARFEGSFSEGLVLPYDGEGVFVSRLS